MKKLNLFLIITMLFLANHIFAQGMQPPPPIKSALLDAMMGTWSSDPYEMLGMKMTDQVTHSMILNGQFLEIDVKGKADNGFTYDAKGIIAPSTDGMTGWFFDIFGKDGIETITGTVNGNTITIIGTGNWGTEKRVITVDGNTMTHNVTMTMKDPSGKMMPPQTVTINYKKM